MKKVKNTQRQTQQQTHNETSLKIQNVLVWLGCKHGDVIATGRYASSIMLCFTPIHLSVRCRLKSFTSCVFLVDSRPRFCN